MDSKFKLGTFVLLLLMSAPLKATVMGFASIVIVDQVSDLPTNGQQGQVAYVKNDGKVYQWSGSVWSFTSPLAAVAFSSSSVSYLGISSTPWTSTMIPLSSSFTFQSMVSGATTYLTIGSSSTFNQSLTQLSSYTALISSVALSYTAISTDALKISYSSSSLSYLGISSTSVDSLTKSSGSLSYVGISSLTAANQVLTLSSAAASYTAVSTFNVLGSGPSVYSGVGAGYTFTTTTNTITVAGSSVTVTIGAAGTYLLFGEANVTYNAATFAASQFLTLVIYRQNNTPGIITNTFVQPKLRIVTAITDNAGFYEVPVVVYITTNANDVLSLHGSITAAPSAGSLQANKASLLAIRIK